MTTLASIGFDKHTTHFGFADEANWNEGRFRSVACLSSRTEHYDEIEQRLCTARCVAGAKISEVKWNALTDYERQRDANSVLKALVELVSEGKLRVAILVWDNNQISLKDEERLQRGYYSILHFATKAFLQESTEDPTIWTYAIHSPDSSILGELENQLEQEFSLVEERIVINLRKAKSELNYMVQVADIVAGLSAYSCKHANDFQTWLDSGRPSHLEIEAASWENRFPLIADFQTACQGAGLEISLGDELREKLDAIPMGETTEIIASLSL